MSAQTLIFRTTIITCTLHLASTTCFFRPIYHTYIAMNIATGSYELTNPNTGVTALCAAIITDIDAASGIKAWTYEPSIGIVDEQKLAELEQRFKDAKEDPRHLYFVMDHSHVWDTRTGDIVVKVEGPPKVNEVNNLTYWAMYNPSAYHVNTPQEIQADITDKHGIALEPQVWLSWRMARNASGMRGYTASKAWLDVQHPKLRDMIGLVEAEAANVKLSLDDTADTADVKAEFPPKTSSTFKKTIADLVMSLKYWLDLEKHKDQLRYHQMRYCVKDPQGRKLANPSHDYKEVINTMILTCKLVLDETLTMKSEKKNEAVEGFLNKYTGKDPKVLLGR